MNVTTATWGELGLCYNTIAFILGHIVLGALILAGMIFLFFFLLNLYRAFRRRKVQVEREGIPGVATSLGQKTRKKGAPENN